MSVHCPRCGVRMDDHGLIAMDQGRGSIEMERYNCPGAKCDTVVLVGATSEMGDN